MFHVKFQSNWISCSEEDEFYIRGLEVILIVTLSTYIDFHFQLLCMLI